MSSYLTIGIVITLGWILAWILHRRSYQSLLENLKLLSAEKSGTIKQRILTLPKLHFTYDGKQVEISSASTGASGESETYTYVLISGLDFDGFEFRILPKSVQTIIDDKLGIKKQIFTEDSLFDKYLTVYSNDKDKILKILNDETKSDLLKWTEKKPINMISDIRNYDDKLIFCVYGKLKDQYDFERLINSAMNFYNSQYQALISFGDIAN